MCRAIATARSDLPDDVGPSTMMSFGLFIDVSYILVCSLIPLIILHSFSTPPFKPNGNVSAWRPHFNLSTILFALRITLLYNRSIKLHRGKREGVSCRGYNGDL